MADAAVRLKAALADRYRIEGELGAGGMATVYLAEDLKHHRPVGANALYYSGNYDRLAGIMPLVRSKCDESRVGFYAGLLAARRANPAEVEHWVQVLEKVPTDNPYARGENQWSMAQMRAILGDRVGAIEHLRQPSRSSPGPKAHEPPSNKVRPRRLLRHTAS